ncbi:MAG: S-adenosylmethionine:tRNA ribosyltransferase-isomerase [Crocinitomicaceae bacterium]|jgi:S-adenosylmethionine:tRNA ribosyltransferase-isomerase
MSSIKNIQISDFTYHLPDERIAKYPLSERDASKLLVYENDSIHEDVYKNFADYIPENTLMIYNNTKVVEARMLFHTETGAVVELFYLEAVDKHIDASLAMCCQGELEIKCYIGNAKRWKKDTLTRIIDWNGQQIELTLSNKERVNDFFHVTLSWSPTEIVFAEILHAFGSIPLPPYLNRETETSDVERYQTTFAKESGSVAAPTAGLHFTEKIIRNLENKGVKNEYVTLHVGAGTFKPVKSEEIGGHEMHGEYLDVDINTIQSICDSLGDKTIVTVGTTSTRTVESLYWIGRKLFFNPELKVKELEVQQWEPYETKELCTPKEAYQALIDFLQKENQPRFISRTQIIIAPGYKYNIINALVTNFHQPESTLLLLISALVGDSWRGIYEYALNHNFRFLSYGDGSLLWKK